MRYATANNMLLKREWDYEVTKPTCCQMCLDCTNLYGSQRINGLPRGEFTFVVKCDNAANRLKTVVILKCDVHVAERVPDALHVFRGYRGPICCALYSIRNIQLRGEFDVCAIALESTA